MRKLTQIKEQFDYYITNSYRGAADMPPEQREQLETAFYGGVRLAVTAIMADPMKLIEYDIELGVWIKEYEARHGL